MKNRLAAFSVNCVITLCDVVVVRDENSPSILLGDDVVGPGSARFALVSNLQGSCHLTVSDSEQCFRTILTL